MHRSLSITQESALLTPSAAPTATIWPLLSAPDSFKIMTTPAYYKVMDGMGWATVRKSGTETTGLGATLTIPVPVSEAEFLMGWAFQRIVGGGTPKPWATTEPVGDLASCRLVYNWSNFEGSIRTKAFKGCKVAAASFGASRTSPVVMMTLQLVGCVPDGNSYDGTADPATALPLPSVYKDDFLLFHHLRGGLTIGGGTRTNFESFEFSVQNALKAYFDEYRFANAVRIGGRSASLKAKLRLKEDSDDREKWEDGESQAAKLEFNDSVKKITIDLKAKNWVDQLDEMFPADEEIYYDLALANHTDGAAGADFTLTVAAA